MKINGNNVSLPEGTTLLAYLEQQQYRLDRIAVEHNGDIVPREQYGSLVLQENDTLEVVSFVGGG